MEVSACEILKELNITSPPINIYKILRDEGIEVDFVNFRNWDLHGCYINNITGPSIGINSKHIVTKKRFTAAHEYKHHIHDMPFQEGGSSGFRCVENEHRVHIEKTANTFAAELLAPKWMIRNIISDLGDCCTISILSGIFNISYMAMAYRLTNTGNISDRKKKNYLASPGRKEDLIKTRNVYQVVKSLPAFSSQVINIYFGMETDVNYCRFCSQNIFNSDWEVCSSCGNNIT